MFSTIIALIVVTSIPNMLSAIMVFTVVNTLVSVGILAYLVDIHAGMKERLEDKEKRIKELEKEKGG